MTTTGAHRGEHEWNLPGSAGEPILGVAHDPSPGESGPVATVLLAHGFKGYMDYGMFPRLARGIAAAGCRVHRFNFSHSGMTRDPSTFARPELFERDTWNRQVEDLAAIAAAVVDGRLEGGGRPLVLVGHSRGGAAVLLAAGRGAVPPPAGIVTAASPADASRLSDADRRRLREDGFLASPSARTGQELRIGREWQDEIDADPPGHDPCVQSGRIRCPRLIVHGEADETVSAADAQRLADAAAGPARTVIIPGANHVFDTPNPLPEQAPTPAALGRLIDETVSFVRSVAGAGD